MCEALASSLKSTCVGKIGPTLPALPEMPFNGLPEGCYKKARSLCISAKESSEFSILLSPIPRLH